MPDEEVDYSPLELNYILEKEQESAFWAEHPQLAKWMGEVLNQGRKHSLMIVCTPEENERILNSRWYRASGDCICEKCREAYHRHPYLSTVPTLHLLCSGQWVKT